jgi:transcriptional regulator with XRE-family HTH domain
MPDSNGTGGGAMKNTKQLLGARIKELRKGLGLSQDQFSERIGVDPKHLSRIELGKSFPYMETLEAIARALEVELKDLFDFSHLDTTGMNRQLIDDLLAEADEKQLQQAYRVVKALIK